MSTSSESGDVLLYACDILDSNSEPSTFPDDTAPAPPSEEMTRNWKEVGVIQCGPTITCRISEFWGFKRLDFVGPDGRRLEHPSRLSVWDVDVVGEPKECPPGDPRSKIQMYYAVDGKKYQVRLDGEVVQEFRSTLTFTVELGYPDDEI